MSYPSGTIKHNPYTYHMYLQYLMDTNLTDKIVHRYTSSENELHLSYQKNLFAYTHQNRMIRYSNCFYPLEAIDRFLFNISKEFSEVEYDSNDKVFRLR